MGKISWLCAAALAMLGCDALFGNQMPVPPATTASFDPTVSFPSGLDCSAAGADPISVSWDLRPISLTVNAEGVSSEISTQEVLINSAGTPTDCFYTPQSSVSDASSSGLRPGTWQITLTHTVSGYPNPVVCTRQLAVGGNQVTFVITPQNAGCQ